MRKIAGEIRLSASDIMRFKVCAHATALDLRHMEIGDLSPVGDDEEAELLQRQGDAHELAYLEQLRADGRTIVEIAKDGIQLEESVRLTREALLAGADIIFQGAFLSGPWGGYSDFLEKVDRPSNLGSHSYEVVDTKLKRSPDPKHILQLVLYSDLLAEMQGTAPEFAHLELGNGTRFSIRLADVSAYSRHARGMLQSFLAEWPETRSEPVSGCGLCRWRDHCQDEWDRADSLALVAGMGRSQRVKVEAAGIATISGLAAFEGRIPHLALPTQQRLQTQARLQNARRNGGDAAFELRTHEPGRGFALLPQADNGDIFYDIEGDPYFAGGLEYLHGVWYRVDGAWVFRAFWAHDREEEGRAVAALLVFFADHMRRHPQAHIYHYAAYEMTALRKLTALHRVGEAVMDQLQRERRFVDLYRVVSGGLIASEPGYSIKNLEIFYMEKRDGDVATAGASVVFYERWRETAEDALLEKIEDYNRTDCVSTQLLRDWLIANVRPVDQPWPILAEVSADSALADVDAEEAEIAALSARLDPVRARLGTEAADLLLDLNFFHKREDKPAWWSIFDKLAQESEDLVDDLDCLIGLEAVGPATPVTKQSYQRVYSYPLQETKLRAGKRPCLKPADGPDGIEITAMDRDQRTITLKRTYKKGDLPDRIDLLPPMPIANKTLRQAIAAVTDDIIAGRGGYQAIEHLLCRTLPTFLGGARAGGIVDPAGDLPAQTGTAIADMDNTTLAIQGPPGTGKTYVSALSIVDLVRAGRRCAISSNSHKAIGNLVAGVAERAAAEGLNCRIVRKASDDGDDDDHPLVTMVADNDAPEIATADVVGATAWHFARYDEPAYDYLFVDEAGQVSMANICAMARAAKNIVLVGDPMQLPQPLQGIHPGRSGESALEYLMDGSRVIPPERGIFMPVSRRMHPDVCRFISAAVYDSKLVSDAAAGTQTLVKRDGTVLIGATLEPVVHFGRSQTCAEEITVIRSHIDAILGSHYRDREGVERELTLRDILVVAPYNAAVNELIAALPAGIRVGTVDRFQGQEAPVCLVSMTTSSAEEMPRDIDFLFSLNRINVAISRAQVAAIVLASPLLLEVPCRTVKDMTLVNTLCLLHEYGSQAAGR